MTRAEERWQEQLRYAADTGTVPPVRRTGLRRFGRRFLIAFIGLLSTLVAVSSYASRGSNQAPVPVLQQATQVASAQPEAAKKRSFTRNVTSEATPPPEHAVPQAAPGREHLTHADPAPTQATSGSAAEDAPRNASRTLTSPKLSGQAQVSNNQRRATARLTVKQQREARRIAGSKSVAARATSTAKPHGRTQSDGEWASQPGPHRIAVAAPAQTVGMCLFLVGCF